MDKVTLIQVWLLCCISVASGFRRRSFPIPSANPKITLSGFLAQDSAQDTNENDAFNKADVYESDFVTKNGSNFVISSNTYEVDFICQANYPVIWNIPHTGQFTGQFWNHFDISNERSSEFSEDLKTGPRNKQYFANLKIKSLSGGTNAFLSGFLSCVSLKNPRYQTSVYVYVQGTSRLENAGMGEPGAFVNVSDFTNRVVLPCRPNNPDTSVMLAKETKVNTFKIGFIHGASHLEYVTVPLDESIRFDPQIGFILDRTVTPDIFGKYKCFLADDEEVCSFVEVAKGDEPHYEFIPHILKSKSAQVTINDILNTVTCCTGSSSISAKYEVMECKTQTECEFFKPSFMHTYLQSRADNRLLSTYVDNCHTMYMNTYSHASNVFICEGLPTLDLAGQYLSGFKNASTAHSRIGNRDSSATTTSPPQPHNNLYDISNGAQDIPLDQKIKFQFEMSASDIFQRDIAYDSPSVFVPYDYVPQRSSTVSRLHGGQMDELLNVYRLLQPYVQWLRSTSMFEGGILRIACIPMEYFYAKGAWLRLNWKNGSRTILPHFFSEDRYSLNYIGESYYVDGYGQYDSMIDQSSVAVYGIVNRLDLEMDSIDCFTPILNDVKWEKQTFKLDIKTTELPQFEYPELETITLKSNTTNVTVSCTVLPINGSQGGILPTQITWRKDGKELQWGNDIVQILPSSLENVTESSLNFEVFTHEMQGEYECLASNVKGTVSKVFKIYVGSGESSILVTVTVTVGILSLLMVVLGLLAWGHFALRGKLGRLSAR